MYRLLTMASLLFWVVAMSALIVRDVWPAWTAQDPPAMTRAQIEELDERRQQMGIYLNGDRRLGTAWSNITLAGGNMTIYGTVVTERYQYLPPLRVETSTEFEASGGLDSFELVVHGLPSLTVRAQGERRGIYFPCTLQVGTLHRQANLDLSASRMIGESFQPFSYLPELEVGQSWRMQILDPVSAVLSRRTQFRSQLARVVKKETIEHNGQPIECFVVKTSPQEITAWVNADGEIIMQQVQVPGLGLMTLHSEPYDEQARIEAKRRITS